MTVHRDRFLLDKTNKRTEFQIYWYYDSPCFGQPFRPSSGIRSRTSALVPFATSSRMELLFHPVPGSKRSAKLHKNVLMPMHGYELLMMGGNAARNMYSRNTNKFEIQCVCWFYSQGSVLNCNTYD